MRVPLIGLSLVAAASLTTATRQCRLYHTNALTALPTTSGTASVTTDATERTMETLSSAPHITSTSETTTTSATVSSETSISRPVVDTVIPTSSGAAISMETSATQSIDEVTMSIVETMSDTSAIPTTVESVTSAQAVSSEAPTTTVAVQPTTSASVLATFAMEAGNTVNTHVVGNRLYGYGDRYDVFFVPDSSWATYWTRYSFNLEPDTNYLRMDDVYVAHTGQFQAIYPATRGSLESLGLQYIRCNDAHDGEVLSCAVAGDSSITQFIIPTAESNNVKPRIINPNPPVSGYFNVDLIARLI